MRRLIFSRILVLTLALILVFFKNQRSGKHSALLPISALLSRTVLGSQDVLLVGLGAGEVPGIGAGSARAGQPSCWRVVTEKHPPELLEPGFPLWRHRAAQSSLQGGGEAGVQGLAHGVIGTWRSSTT